jgi:16S rRNA (uracil1498-N3)-methyltransferase
MRRRFFVDAFEGRTASVHGEAAHHLSRVLRVERDELYELSDGRTLWLARVENVGRDAVDFTLVEQLPVWAPPLEITLLLAVVKFDRFEWALEKATESGVSSIVPLAAERSEKHLLAAAPKRAERWEKIIHESAQQCRRLKAPDLATLTDAAEALCSAAASVRILLSEKPDALPIKQVLAGKRERSAAIAIGPEGGWVEPEIQAARKAGFAEASLGRLILRTETAVVAALTAVNYALGE